MSMIQIKSSNSLNESKEKVPDLREGGYFKIKKASPLLPSHIFAAVYDCGL